MRPPYLGRHGVPSTLNIGAGGIVASGGEIQVKFNVNNQDAVLNLAGFPLPAGDARVPANVRLIRLPAYCLEFSEWPDRSAENAGVDWSDGWVEAGCEKDEDPPNACRHLSASSKNDGLRHGSLKNATDHDGILQVNRPDKCAVE